MSQSKGFLKIIVLVLVFMVVAGGIYYIFTKINKPRPEVNQEQIETRNQESINQENKAGIEPVTSAPKDCGGDINCLISAAKNNCQLAKVSHAVTMPNPGYVFIAALLSSDESLDKSLVDLIADLGTVTTNNYYEIRGREGNNCIIYEKLLGGSVKRNQDKINQLIVSGEVTADDIAREVTEIENATLEEFRRTVGRDATCKVTAQEFQAKIDKVLSGIISFRASIDPVSGKAINEDPYAQKCTGRLYDLNR